MHRLAAFITPHGYGHATRTIAILEALQRRVPGLQLELFTTLPEQLFAESLQSFTLHPVVTDVGLVQTNALEADLAGTVAALNRLLPFDEKVLTGIAGQVEKCDCVLCDIAPLGIVAAERASLPSVLVGNFTWDWIYHPYTRGCPELAPPAEYLAAIYKRATLRILTEPFCEPVARAVSCPPVFRPCRMHPARVQEMLGAGQRRIVLISMGGIGFPLTPWPKLAEYPECLFVLAGQEYQQQLTTNCLALSRHSCLYHPDLIAAADLVIFKSGYSTTAECLQSGTRALCISRQGFAESEILADFVTRRLTGTVIQAEDFIDGSWLTMIPSLLARPRPHPARENGAEQAAEHILALAGGRV